MNIIFKIERLQKLNKLIEQEQTGTPNELSDYLGISRSKLYELIDGLNGMGKKVRYNRTTKSFYYSDNNKLVIQFSLKLISPKELEKIEGGKKMTPNFFMDGLGIHSLIINDMRNGYWP